jgi:hypothetical protein
MKDFIGRKNTLTLLSEFINKEHPIINIYGIGGIGKSYLSLAFHETLLKKDIISIYINAGALSSLTIDKLLGLISSKLDDNNIKLDDFSKHHEIYTQLQIIEEKFGGINKLFNFTGDLSDSIPVLKYVNAITTISDEVRRFIKYRVEKRYRYDEYLRGATSTLIDSFTNDINTIKKDIIIILDSYERFEFLDNEIRTTFSKLPKNIKFLLVGRNQLKRIDFQWNTINLNELHLDEFTKEESKEYLLSKGLKNEGIFNKIYTYTGGYPLALALTVDLSIFSGWDNINLSTLRDLDHLSQGILERIIEGIESQDIKNIIEIGPIASWLNPEIISLLINVDENIASQVYDELSSFSFIEYHQNGFRFHDRIREILIPRLKYRKKTKFMNSIKALKKYYAQFTNIENNI